MKRIDFVKEMLQHELDFVASLVNVTGKSREEIVQRGIKDGVFKYIKEGVKKL